LVKQETSIMAQNMATASQEQVDAEIRQTALDYIEGWYDGDPDRMERTLHPDLAKRIVIPNPDGNGDRLDQMSAMTLIRMTRHEPRPAHERRSEITILHRYVNTASVRVDASTWIDYMHLAKWNGRWAIVNVLWANRTGATGDVDNTALLRAARLYPLELSLHPELAKRVVGPVYSPSPEWPSPSWPPGDKLYQLSALSLVQAQLPWSRGPAMPDEELNSRARTILDRFENVASVKADADYGVDYLHMAKWNGEWLIVNILWELGPQAAATWAARDAARASQGR
jgi:hypothetical protein